MNIATNLHTALILDVQPTPGAICDFGIDSVAHYAALQYAVKRGGVTADQLQAVLGDGKAITALCEGVEGQPYHVDFHTAYDDLGLGAEEPNEEIETDENADEGFMVDP